MAFLVFLLSHFLTISVLMLMVIKTFTFALCCYLPTDGMKSLLHLSHSCPILWLYSWIPRGGTQLDMQICQHWFDELSPRYLSLECRRYPRPGISTVYNKILNNRANRYFPELFFMKKRDSKGHLRTPHGGCACLANPTISIPFRSSDDETGVWDTLEDSARVAAVWIQVLPKVKAFCIAFSGHPNVSDGENCQINDHLIGLIFTLSAQHGDVPIIFSGGFQADPDIYQSVVNAKSSGRWHDPLTSIDCEGQRSRPITFLRNGNFKDPTDHFSSIDALLVNSVSLAALTVTSIKVCYDGIKAHAPIEASFDWPCILQKGPVLVKTAHFDLTTLVKLDGKPDMEHMNQIATSIWDSKYKDRFDRVDDETAWKYVNQLSIQTLLQSGATFQEGLKTRGKAPEFTNKLVFPGQDKSGSAATRESLRLSKAFNIVAELRARLQRKSNKHDDLLNTFNLRQKVTKTLVTFKNLKWWNPAHHLHDDALRCVQDTLHKMIVETKLKEKHQRISSWKRIMAHGTSSKNVANFVFKWIRNKTKINSPNLIKNQDGDIISDPQTAINEINLQWDSIFGVNACHEDPRVILQHIWPSIQNIRFTASIPSLSGEMLVKQAARRNISAAPGTDGWRTSEVRTLPLHFFT